MRTMNLLLFVSDVTRLFSDVYNASQCGISYANRERAGDFTWAEWYQLRSQESRFPRTLLFMYMMIRGYSELLKNCKN
jgi:hypothetical protein